MKQMPAAVQSFTPFLFGSDYEHDLSFLISLLLTNPDFPKDEGSMGESSTLTTKNKYQTLLTPSIDV